MLLFDPTTIHVASLKAIHLESRGNNDKQDQPKKSSIKPHNGKFKGKGKGKDKKATTTKKEEWLTPSCTHCKKEYHDDEHRWNLYLKPKRFGGKSKQKIVKTVQQELRFISGDETQTTTVSIQGNISLHANENY